MFSIVLYCTHTRCRSKRCPGPTRPLQFLGPNFPCACYSITQYHQNLTWATLQKSWIHTCICYRAHTKFSEFLSFCLQGVGRSSTKKSSSQTSSAKKCSCLEGGGWIISQKALQIAYISIMHCSLPVISLLTCCQKEVLESCICL